MACKDMPLYAAEHKKSEHTLIVAVGYESRVKVGEG